MNQATLLKWPFDSKEIVTKINLLLSDASKRTSATRKYTVWNKLGWNQSYNNHQTHSFHLLLSLSLPTENRVLWKGGTVPSVTVKQAESLLFKIIKRWNYNIGSGSESPNMTMIGINELIMASTAEYAEQNP